MTLTIYGLDLFSGAGGCTKGYQEGFAAAGINLHMTGVDCDSQPRYCGDRFFKGNAMEVLLDEPFINAFHFIHMSPPCQYFSPTRTLSKTSTKRVDLLTPALAIIKERYAGKIWITENVPEAPMYSRVHQILRLCASSFPGHSAFDERRLLHRHRHFRLHNFSVPKMPCNHNGYKPKGVYGALNSEVPGGGEIAANFAEAKKLMQIDWMKWYELKESVPPAYTRYITSAPGGLAELFSQIRQPISQ